MHAPLKTYTGEPERPSANTQDRKKLFALLRGRPNRHMSETTGYSSYNADRLRLHMDGLWALDGELYRASTGNGPVTISNAATMTFVRL